MNIFYIHKIPTICAQYHTDVHVRKMLVELAQILSTAHRVQDGFKCIEKTKKGRKITRYKLSDPNLEQLLYKSTHVNHPSMKWVRESPDNYSWAVQLLHDLSREYTYRFGKIHKTEQIGLVSWLHRNFPKNFVKDQYFTEPACAMPEKYIIKNNSLRSYQDYYKFDKSHLHKWTKRNVPEFIEINS